MSGGEAKGEASLRAACLIGEGPLEADPSIRAVARAPPHPGLIAQQIDREGRRGPEPVRGFHKETTLQFQIQNTETTINS